MPGKQYMTHQPSPQEGIAFEYVAGTLSADERVAYERRLENASEERERVAFWQSKLSELDLSAGTLQPEEDTWQAIAAATSPRSEPATSSSKTTLNVGWLKWAAPSFAMMLLAVVLLGKPLFTSLEAPNTDYIAVLTNSEGGAVLTALTTKNTKQSEGKMWLQWEASEPEDDHSYQLWAISKRDGQVRSLAVFDDTTQPELALSEATFRLVSDSSFLLLTQEEPGGSAIDEPSDALIAKGVCVRFNGDEV